MSRVVSVELVVGMEVHVELATRTKMFSRAGNPACVEHQDAEPNTLIDPVVLALPGALPVLNREAIEMAMRVGVALGCSLAERTKWDRKSYMYADLPKGYQISQYDLPLCFDGVVEVRGENERGVVDVNAPPRKVRIERAHLEEDAGKLLHEAPGGAKIDFSIVDLNRAGTPLLEIVTHPDFRSADEAVGFARRLRQTCRYLGVSDCVMERGQIRFEPNINTVLTLKDGRTVRTPIVEVKNLNSFRAVRGAIEHELIEQPRRWERDGREQGPGTKSTRGWDEARGVTVPQREKEDAHDYRYFPDPDLTAVLVSGEWRERVAGAVGLLPGPLFEQLVSADGLDAGAAGQIVEERPLAEFYLEAVRACEAAGVSHGRASRGVGNALLQSGQRLSNERGVGIDQLGIEPAQVGALVALREEGSLGSSALDGLFEKMCEVSMRGQDARTLAEREGLLTVRDAGQLKSWVEQVLAGNPAIVEQIRAGKQQAIGRLIGETMKLSGGAADAGEVRRLIMEKIGT
ncbi:MAG: Asp-tRNA(Asn)/Glu-tRNA(Gln) amidotransferase subunit GatB [Leptolyngbya sp. PLA3]|nr:MAG: Asp-tRNA(Asn)/Glu-tRNA(Gln) amidotransferase subunit GatB [Cyanobacteria bacterium CYA]MCE7967323.1 Asp-tRNA(Asn)/Glu-tRNA(Gln) amidotransferase subunit GatB [Leptolyngbya sp. PL-A3]